MYQEQQFYYDFQTPSIEELDLLNPDVLQNCEQPLLKKCSSKLGILQSFQNLENQNENENIQTNFPLMQIYEYNSKNLNGVEKKESKKQPQIIDNKVEHQQHFLSESDGKEIINQKETNQQENLTKKKSNLVAENLLQNLKQHWFDTNQKGLEVFKIREKKNSTFFLYCDYSKKKL